MTNEMFYSIDRHLAIFFFVALALTAITTSTATLIVVASIVILWGGWLTGNCLAIAMTHGMVNSGEQLFNDLKGRSIFSALMGTTGPAYVAAFLVMGYKIDPLYFSGAIFHAIPTTTVLYGYRKYLGQMAR